MPVPEGEPYVYLGPTPVDEHCQQVGTAGYDEQRAIAECRIYADQCRRLLQAAGQWRDGIILAPFPNRHDFGTYYEVGAWCTEGAGCLDALYWLEENLPEEWDATARAQLAAT